MWRPKLAVFVNHIGIKKTVLKIITSKKMATFNKTADLFSNFSQKRKSISFLVYIQYLNHFNHFNGRSRKKGKEIDESQISFAAERK